MTILDFNKHSWLNSPVVVAACDTHIRPYGGASVADSVHKHRYSCMYLSRVLMGRRRPGLVLCTDR